ncbi:MAG TPA: arginine--tRNA ligase, partial [Gemmataceae bacterium]|nr:arginine--tRNA ligase [Gemmataceae bacterium]
MNVLHRLQQSLHAALSGLVPDAAPYAAMLKPAQGARFGDYQANCAMPMAKALGGKQNPQDVAQSIVQRLDLGDVLEAPDVAGPGFINLRLRTDWLARQLQALARDERLGVEPAAAPRTVVIDYSSPNVAKPMHVGHLRSTIIGDALARLYRFLGHHVITDNHLGDWGTQFGILLYGYKNFLDEAAFKADPVRELARLYVHVRSLFRVAGEDEEEDNAADPVQQACREETAKLHAGDEENVRLWKMFMPYCREDIDRIYRRLDVHFDHTLGESFYNPMLPGVVRDLLQKGIAQESEGAVIVSRGEGLPPALIRKRDGAFTYTTTDLATIQYRLTEWHAEAVLYVVDFRQKFHFESLFAAAKRWGCAADLEHVSFGTVLGRDRKPFKTRSGGVPELGDLLDESIRHAAQVYEANRREAVERGQDVPELSAEELGCVHEVVGYGAVKYA